MEQVALDRGPGVSLAPSDPAAWFDKMTVKIDLMKQVEDRLSVDLTLVASQLAATAQTALTWFASMAVASLVVSILGAFVIARSIVRPLQTLTTAAEALAQGDLDHDLGPDRLDELGQLANSFRRLIASQQEVAAMANAMAEGDLSRTIVAKSSKDVLGTAFETMATNLRDLVGQVQSSAVTLAETSAQLGSAANQTGLAVQQVTMAVQNVASGAQDTSRSAQETNHAVAQLSQVIDGIARGATDQARQVQTTSATAATMAAGVEEVATNANQVATASQQTKVVAEHGGQAVRETTAAMAEIQTVVGQAASKVRELGTLGQKIGAVVETIDDIAEQTNLLALNAAIEAARAGEHGKGFAVVADEVRKLAERSGRETKQIAELIAQVQTGTQEAVAAMDSGAAKVELGSQKADQAGRALQEILEAVQATVRQVGEIASSSQQMASGARSVTDAMHSISAVVEESTAATEEMSAQASQVTTSIQSIAAVSEQQSAATEAGLGEHRRDERPGGTDERPGAGAGSHCRAAQGAGVALQARATESRPLVVRRRRTRSGYGRQRHCAAALSSGSDRAGVVGAGGVAGSGADGREHQARVRFRPRLLERLQQDVGRLRARDAVAAVDHEEWDAVDAQLGRLSLFGADFLAVGVTRKYRARLGRRDPDLGHQSHQRLDVANRLGL